LVSIGQEVVRVWGSCRGSGEHIGSVLFKSTLALLRLKIRIPGGGLVVAMIQHIAH
jgi:hypothetical protein